MKWFLSFVRSLAIRLNVRNVAQASTLISTKTDTQLKPDTRGTVEQTKKLVLGYPVSKDTPISSPYGPRVIDGKEEFHKGIDFKCPVGTIVYASEDGAAFRCGYQNPFNEHDGFGLRVWQEIERIENEKKVRYYVFYAHLSKILIEEGSHIKKGQEIGLSGNTGRSTGPHLHLGAREKDTGNWLDMEFV